MAQQTVRCILTLFALALTGASIARAQPETSTEIPDINEGHSWQAAQSASSSKREVVVVTLDQPGRRHACRIRSFSSDKLVCSRVLGGPHTYLREQVAAVILRGDDYLRIPLWLGLNGGLGTAIWGTVVLAAACPACAAATGVAALVLFCAAGAIAYGDDQPDRLLYLATGQQLSHKLGFVQY